MPDDPIITLTGVSKRFGAKVAVDDVTVQVPRGRCFGWLGPNGCGKTTLIRMMLGLARPSAGRITVRGHSVPAQTRRALSRVGAIVEEPRFYPYLSGRANLAVWAAHYDRAAAGRVDPALRRVGLLDRADDPVKAYSLGMRQRLGVARALLNDPELLVLDEPTNGLDPAGMHEFRHMIRSLVEQEGRTVFISSHILDEVQKMADDIAIVQDGRLVSCGPVAELLADGGTGVLLRVDDEHQARRVLSALSFVGAVSSTARGHLELTVPELHDRHLIELNRALVRAEVGVAELRTRTATLEERFLAITAAPADRDPVDPSHREVAAAAPLHRSGDLS